MVVVEMGRICVDIPDELEKTLRFKTIERFTGKKKAVPANEKAIEALKKGRRVEEVLLTAEDFYLIVRILSGTRFCAGLAIPKEGNVGMARMAMKQYEKRFVETLSTN
jgi:hypothetical protein